MFNLLISQSTLELRDLILKVICLQNKIEKGTFGLSIHLVNTRAIVSTIMTENGDENGHYHNVPS